MKNTKTILVLAGIIVFILIPIGLVWVAMNFQNPKTDENLAKTMGNTIVTDGEAVQMVRSLSEVKGYEALLAQSDKIATIEAEDNDTEWNVHVYEIVVQDGVSHTATFGWYQVDKKTGKLSSENFYSSSEDVAGLSTSRPFADVYPENENFNAIKYLTKEGVVTGDENGNFKPEQIVSRAEWVQMLVKFTGAKPDAADYHDCFIDVKKESFAPSVCYAKEKGWIEGVQDNLSIRRGFKLFVNAALASEEKSTDRFAPSEPVKGEQAIGSLARATAWNVNGSGKAMSEDVQNMTFASQAGIYKPQNADGVISREQAAGIMFRSAATVSFGQEKYDSKYDAAVLQNSLKSLIDKISVDKDEGFSTRRQAYIDHYAEDFGKAKAAELVDKSGSEDELRKNVRNFRFERMVEGEKAAGKEAKSFNAFRPIQSFFSSKGQSISIEDADIYKSDPANDSARSKVSDPTFKPREGASVSIFLDDQYRVIPRSDLGQVKISFIVNTDVSSFYGEGWTNDARGVGFVTVDIVDFNTGVIIAAGQSERSVITEGNLINMYKIALQDMEHRIGAEIMPPPGSRDESGYIPIVPSDESDTAGGSSFDQPDGTSDVQTDETEQPADESGNIDQQEEESNPASVNAKIAPDGTRLPDVIWTAPR